MEGKSDPALSGLPAGFAELATLPSEAAFGFSVDLLLSQFPSHVAHRIRLCAIPQQVDHRIIAVLDPALEGRAETALAELTDVHTLVTRLPNGYLAVHDAARRHLFAAWLRPDADTEFVAVNSRLAAFFHDAVAHPAEHPLFDLRRQYVFHLVGSDQASGIAEFEALVRTERRRLRFDACATLIRLVRQFEPVLTRTHKAILQYHDAKLRADLRDNEQAIAGFRALLNDPETPGPLRIKAAWRLGMVYRTQRNWAEAMRSYESAREWARETPDLFDDAPILNSLGTLLLDMGRFDDAERMLKESIDYSTRADARYWVAVSNNALGGLYLRRGDVSQAIDAFHHSLAILQELGIESSQVYTNLGTAYADEPDWERSREYFERGLQLSRSLGDVGGQARALMSLARVHASSRRPDQAVAMLTEAEKFFEEVRDKYNAGLAAEQVGHVLRRMGNSTGARAAFDRAMDAFRAASATDRVDALSADLNAAAAGRRWMIGCVTAFIIGFVLLLIVSWLAN